MLSPYPLSLRSSSTPGRSRVKPKPPPPPPDPPIDSDKSRIRGHPTTPLITTVSSLVASPTSSPTSAKRRSPFSRSRRRSPTPQILSSHSESPSAFPTIQSECEESLPPRPPRNPERLKRTYSFNANHPDSPSKSIPFIQRRRSTNSKSRSASLVPNPGASPRLSPSGSTSHSQPPPPPSPHPLAKLHQAHQSVQTVAGVVIGPSVAPPTAMPSPPFLSRQPESSSRPRSTSAATNMSQSTRPSTSTRTSTRQSTSTQTSDPTTRSPSIPSQDSKFNTTERAILAELQAAVAARAAQFVYKGHPGMASVASGAFKPERKQSAEGASNRSKGSIASHTITVPADSPTGNSTEAATRSTSDVLASLDVHGGLDNSRRRHHPHVTREVPYPRSYERGVIDLDVWETLWCKQTCGSVTWHVFEEAPTKVLDIGCGTGTWILECATTWKKCHFVGLDIVPLHPDLMHVSSPELARRVQWVQANFLEGLPFPNDEFDFVHIKRIARGVPEDKWDDLFEEISRVMKPGGALEIIEEDLTFPGKPSDKSLENGVAEEMGKKGESEIVKEKGAQKTNITHSIPHSSTLPPLSPGSYIPSKLRLRQTIRTRAMTLSDISHPRLRIHDLPLASPPPDYPPPPPPPSGPLPPPPGNVVSAPTGYPQPRPPPNIPLPPVPLSAPLESKSALPSTPDSPVLGTFDVERRDIGDLRTRERGGIDERLRVLQRDSGAVGRDREGGKRRKLRRPLTAGSVPTSTTASQGGESPSLGMKPFLQRTISGPDPGTGAKVDGARLIGGLVKASGSTSRFVETEFVRAVGRGATKSVETESSSSGAGSSSSNLPSSTSSSECATPTGVHSATPTGVKSFTPTGAKSPPRNPRDHTVLEAIYTETHAQRFVNLAPLSLLANTVGTWFKDVRTHPPIVFTFPPPGDGSSQQGGVNEGITLGDNLFYRRNPGPPIKIISLQGLLQGVSPYASLDVARFTAFSPSWKAAFNHTAMQDIVHVNANAKDRDTCDDESNIQPPGSPTSVHTASSSFNTPPSLGSFKSRLPNAMLEVDLRSLNLHLMMRVKEILACAEAMWEWIVDYQEHLRSGSVPSQQAQGLAATGVDAVSKTDTGGRDPIKAAIAGMTRSEFDDLLIRFEMDMRDHMALGPVLEDRFKWSAVPGPISQERQNFDAACEKWANGEHQPLNQLQDLGHKDRNQTQNRQQQQQEHVTQNYISSSAAADVAVAAASTTTLPVVPDSAQAPTPDARETARDKDHSTFLPTSPLQNSSQSTGRDRLKSISTPHPSTRLSRSMRVFVAWKA